MYNFIINPKSSSGRGIRYWWIVKDELERQQVEYTAHFTEYTGHATAIARQICSDTKSEKKIVVLGGDGTLNEVINGIEDYSEVLLGYVPSGSSNDLARSLKIPKDPKEALSRVLTSDKTVTLDHGNIDFPDMETPSRKFSCSSGMGYDANVCAEVQVSPLKKRLNRFGAGKFVYIAIALKQLFTIKLSDATVTIDGNKKDTYDKVLLVSGMIHKYEGGGLLMAPEADPFDGKLSVCLVHGMSKLRMFFLLPTIFTGSHIKHKGVESFHCSQLEIKMNRPVAIHTDGEIAAVSSHIKVSCESGKIRMII